MNSYQLENYNKMSTNMKVQPSIVAFECDKEVILENDVIKLEQFDDSCDLDANEDLKGVESRHKDCQRDQFRWLPHLNGTINVAVSDVTSTKSPSVSTISKKCDINEMNAVKVGKYVCDFCGLKFIKKNLYEIHITIHSNTQLYQCSLCSMGFNQIKDLSIHISEHNPRARYMCDICRMGFVKIKQLRKHLRLDHK